MPDAKPRVLITDGINPQAAALLKDTCEVVYEPKLSAQELLAQVADADALMVRSASTVSAEVLAAGKHLRIVGRAGVGTDNIDVAAATQRGIVVVNSPEGNTIAASEHTVGMLMALARHIPQGDASMKQGQWLRSRLMGVEVYGKTLGVVGLGRIGRRVAKVALQLEMRVNVFDPFLSKAMAEELGVHVASFEEILGESDFITIHAPKTRETQNLFNTEAFKRCKPGLRIVNCARGGIIDEAALAQAIQDGIVAGAALDVFDAEPPEPGNPLLNLENAHAHKLVLTPHLGASTEEAQVNVALDVAEQIRDFFAYGTAKNAVNIPLLRPDMLEPVKHYMPMAEVLGHFVRQLAPGAAQSVSITAKGALNQHRAEPLTLAVLKGLLSGAREGVNYVNAPAIAEESGIQVTESSTRQAENYLNLLDVTLITDTGASRVAATLISDEIFRIVEMDGYRMALEPSPHILIAPHHDRPGMVARVATALGEAGVNISALQVARKGTEAGGESMMAFNLDNPPSDALRETIRQIDGIYDALYIRL